MNRLLLLIYTLLPFLLHAQGEANVWYFGFGAGLDFNTSPPSALTDGMLYSDEGCASICNSAGDLLFYTNGETIWNSGHQIMENGAGMAGHNSSTQSSIIVPKPLSDHLYYVFTLGAEAGQYDQWDGLSYSIVDINADNGLGAVIEKNIPLAHHTTEKQTAIRHANGRDIWILTHLFESNAFLAYLLTCEGIQTQPVISEVGSSHIEPNIGCCEASSTLGCMKSSPDNSKVAVVWQELIELNQQQGLVIADWYLELFDFDNSTGKLSNPITSSYGNDSNNHFSYGICFSPDNTKLYQSVRQGVPSYKLFQYDLEADDILASQTIITEEYIKAFGTMEIGPDGKIYIARTNGHQYLSVLHNPNELGMASNYEKEGVSLAGLNSTWGLPNILYDYSFQTVADLLPADTLVCQEEALILDASNLLADQWLWSDGSTSPEIEIESEGWYWLEINSEDCGMARDSIYVIQQDCSCEIAFPNAFSPNGDQLNDSFKAYDTNCIYEIFDLKVYNRWGAVVFTSQDQYQGWDGFFKNQKSPTGVYVYHLNYQAIGASEATQIYGDVSLIR